MHVQERRKEGCGPNFLNCGIPDPRVEPLRDCSEVLDGAQRQTCHEVNEQNASWGLERQGHVHEVIDAYRVVELLQIDHGKGCVHPVFGRCLRHGALDERAAERSTA